MSKSSAGQTPNYNVRERWPGLLTKEAAAEYLSCSVDYIKRLKASGRLKTVKLGERQYRFRRWDLDLFIDALHYGTGVAPGAGNGGLRDE
ncbi:MAG: hypothetical protein Aurels2KO_28040 [Aureliella sp.]